MKACGSIRATLPGNEIHKDIVQKAVERGSFIGNTLVDMYAKCESLVEAHVVFNRISVQEQVSWNALIARYSKNGKSVQSILAMASHCLTQDALGKNYRFHSIYFICCS